MRVTEHRLTEARYSPSPHQDNRPSAEISLIVVHGISLPPGKYGGNEVEEFFLGRLDTSLPALQDLHGVEVSSHLFIRRSGEVVQFVDFDRRAWHAGDSEFRGRSCCNDFSIGIELEGTDSTDYEDIQYNLLARVCRTLMDEYGISEVHGHCDIAPGRKTDPGPSFEWQKLERLLAQVV